MRIAVLCNSSLAFPALQVLMSQRVVCAAGLAGQRSEATGDLEQLFAQSGVPCTTLSKSSGSLLSWLDMHRPDSVWVLTYPYKIPSEALEQLPFYNFHFSPLPAYRGPNPIFFQIAAGEKASAVSVHRMDAGWDSGPIIFREEFPLSPEDTYGMVTSRLAMAGGQAAIKLLQITSGGHPVGTPQDHGKARYYPRPDARHVLVRWDRMNAEQIRRLVNACNPWNSGAITTVSGQWEVKLTEVEVLPEQAPAGAVPGDILLIDREGMQVVTSDGKLLLVRVVWTEAGIFSAGRLKELGIRPGMRLFTPAGA